MNYFVKQCICITLILIVGNFNSNCFDLEELNADIRKYAINHKPIPIKENVTFEVDEWLSKGENTVVWDGTNFIIQKISRLYSFKMAFQANLLRTEIEKQSQ